MSLVRSHDDVNFSERLGCQSEYIVNFNSGIFILRCKACAGASTPASGRPVIRIPQPAAAGSAELGPRCSAPASSTPVRDLIHDTVSDTFAAALFGLVVAVEKVSTSRLGARRR